MAMTTSTQEAWTEDQIDVLRYAEDSPDATPSEIADAIDDEAITASYVVSILDGFHLPHTPDEPESESIKRIEERTDSHEEVVVNEADMETMEADVRWRCALCGEEYDEPHHVVRHIQASPGTDHDRDPTDPMDRHLVVPFNHRYATVLERLTAHAHSTAPIGPGHLRVLFETTRPGEPRDKGTLAEAAGREGQWVARRQKDLGLDHDIGDNDYLTPERRLAAARRKLRDVNVTFNHAPVEEVLPNRPDVVNLDIGDGPENVVPGSWVEGTVNAVEEYGVFVTLAQSITQNVKDDFSGLAHRTEMVGRYVPADYAIGDEVVVEILGDRDGDTSLRMVSGPDGTVDDDVVPAIPLDADEEDASGAESDASEVEVSPTADGDEPDSGDAADAVEGGFFDSRMEEYERYWKWVDITRVLGEALRESKASKFDSDNSPLARAYNEAQAAKADASEDCYHTPGNLPTYRQQYGVPSWDHRVVETRGDPAHVPADWEMPEEWDGEEPTGFVADMTDEQADMLGRVREIERTVDDMSDVLHDLYAVLEHFDESVASIEERTRPTADGDGDGEALVLSREQLKRLVRDAPDDVADMALDALVDS